MTVSGLTMTRADRQSLQSFAQPRPEEPIGRGQFRPLDRPLQDAELVAKREILEMECGPGFEGRRHSAGQDVKRAERQMRS